MPTLWISPRSAFSIPQEPLEFPSICPSLDFYSGDRASDLGRVYTKEVLLLPEDQGLLFHHTFGKTLRGKDSKNQFAVKRCPQDTVVCPVVNLTTYVKIADLMNINLREGFSPVLPTLKVAFLQSRSWVLRWLTVSAFISRR